MIVSGIGCPPAILKGRQAAFTVKADRMFCATIFVGYLVRRASSVSGGCRPTTCHTRDVSPIREAGFGMDGQDILTYLT